MAVVISVSLNYFNINKVITSSTKYFNFVAKKYDFLHCVLCSFFAHIIICLNNLPPYLYYLISQDSTISRAVDQKTKE